MLDELESACCQSLSSVAFLAEMLQAKSIECQIASMQPQGAEDKPLQKLRNQLVGGVANRSMVYSAWVALLQAHGGEDVLLDRLEGLGLHC